MGQSLIVTMGYGFHLPDFGEYQEKLSERFSDSLDYYPLMIRWAYDEEIEDLLFFPPIVPVDDEPWKIYTHEEANIIFMTFLEQAISSLCLTDEEKKENHLTMADLKYLVETARVQTIDLY